ncbi:hypothetical protein BOTCAL_0587g00070 [Botryotinia calthae]|uniref:Uncharacterized protein n=1 Tax=Botryotinia calthae TaxID=38488 RepID=A0A4Y8CLG9_9HELO|nr:hypothetical protein BOTCAL_0587g00070 [Botryotinia calthae]
MSTIGIRQRRGESSTSTYATARRSFGEWPEPWQDNSLVPGTWGETAEEDQEPAETPDPPSDVSESSSHISTGEEKRRKIEEKFERFVAEEALQQKIDLNTLPLTIGIPDSKVHKSTSTPGTWTETRENKFYVYKAPQRVSFFKPWSWQFPRWKSASTETTKTVGEGHYRAHKERPRQAPKNVPNSSLLMFWTWHWQAPKPVSWIPIYPSHYPEKDDPELKIFIAYKCGHRFPTRMISGPTWTASSPTFLFSPSSPFTPNTPTFTRSGSTSGHPHIKPLPTLQIETLRAAARQEGVKNIISPENYICPNCFIRWQFYVGLYSTVTIWAVFGWFCCFVWPYTWWATTETGEPQRYVFVAQFDNHRERSYSDQAMVGFLTMIFGVCVGIYWKSILKWVWPKKREEVTRR